ncbi:hypothetical protein ACLBUQ_28090, partial [Pseudomonas aeruginosa]
MTATDRTPPPLKWLCLGNRDANDGFELFAHGIYARMAEGPRAFGELDVEAHQQA